MKLSGDIQSRLAAHMRDKITIKTSGEVPFYLLVRHPEKAVVVEQEVAGEARVECSLPEGALCIQWSLPTGLFQFLKSEMNADGALLIWRDDGSRDGFFEAHVMECKKTVEQSTWNKALKQLRWTLLRLRALAGALGVPIQRVTFYTAFREDTLSSTSSRNPLVPRNTITSRFAEPDEIIERPRRLLTAWEDDKIVFEGFEGHFVHHKIELDDAGHGSVGLS